MPTGAALRKPFRHIYTETLTTKSALLSDAQNASVRAVLFFSEQGAHRRLQQTIQQSLLHACIDRGLLLYPECVRDAANALVVLEFSNQASGAL